MFKNDCICFNCLLPKLKKEQKKNKNKNKNKNKTKQNRTKKKTFGVKMQENMEINVILADKSTMAEICVYLLCASGYRTTNLISSIWLVL